MAKNFGASNQEEQRLARKKVKTMFEARLELGDRADVLHLSGDLAIDTVKDLNGIVKELIARERHPLIVDMSELKFIDSRGAAVLIALNYKLKNKTVVLADIPYRIRVVLSRMFIMDQLTVFKTAEDARREIYRVERRRAGAL
ncbi:MAG: STAS domain-containing protein [bacterium]